MRKDLYSSARGAEEACETVRGNPASVPRRPLLLLSADILTHRGDEYTMTTWLLMSAKRRDDALVHEVLGVPVGVGMRGAYVPCARQR